MARGHGVMAVLTRRGMKADVFYVAGFVEAHAALREAFHLVF